MLSLLRWISKLPRPKAVAPFPELRDRFEAHAMRVTATAGASIGAYLAWNGRRVGLAWSDETDGEAEVYFQAFDPTGAALDTAERLTHNPTASLIPAIQPSDDGFALAWNEGLRRTPDSGIFKRRGGPGRDFR